MALVGPSGGGKTTAASLVPRFWDACVGRVLVGGADVRSMEPRRLMEHGAFVFQTNRLFKQNVLENVRAARPVATREEVVRALSAAQCDDIIEKLPDGVDTVYGAAGSSFLRAASASGSQLRGRWLKGRAYRIARRGDRVA